eukprot:scaffold186181_cov25-Tisochrysis_lutea.AAC.1
MNDRRKHRQDHSAGGKPPGGSAGWARVVRERMPAARGGVESCGRGLVGRVGARAPSWAMAVTNLDRRDAAPREDVVGEERSERAGW